jgi:hypothetical protein
MTTTVQLSTRSVVRFENRITQPPSRGGPAGSTRAAAGRGLWSIDPPVVAETQYEKWNCT